MKADPDFEYEKKLWEQGIDLIAGIDEAGRGSLAGPVVSAVVVLPGTLSLEKQLCGVRDSKQMTPRTRNYWAERLKEIALDWRVGFASHTEIDQLGIVPATKLAIMRAMNELRNPPQHLLIDYLKLESCTIRQTSIVKGDQISLSIAAASILAKTSRDEFMSNIDSQYQGYDFVRNKGYGTAAHRAALKKLGPSPVHRTTFRIKLQNP